MTVAPSRLAVLVVDDDNDVRETMVDVVDGSGRLAFWARDGSAALRMLEGAAIPRPCVVLLDWHMSPMGGEEFLACVQARPDAAQLPVLIFTGTDARISSDIGPTVIGVLRKPFGVQEFLETLDRLEGGGG